MAKSGLSEQALEAERLQLAELPPATLLRHWFSRAELGASRSKVAMTLRSVLDKRSLLFEWVYGGGSPIVRDLLYVRLPSSEKRQLVSALLEATRKHHPWLDSRTIHAMAFQPTAFRASPKRPLGSHQQPWGSLYKRIGIPKANGKRVLTIPNPVLMQIHRELRLLLAPMLETSLNANVFGVTRGVRGPTFQNAKTHCVSEFVASFDLKDFFPSVRVADIVRGLQHVKRQGIPMVRNPPHPKQVGEDSKSCDLQWTPDAILLIARLCTHRARLPQGAPLSPLLATVAFSRFDRRIIYRLRKEFGAGEFQYTRYFDDITVSLTRAAAERCGIATPSEALRSIESRLTAALVGSHFSLNHAKSKCAKIRRQRGGRSTLHSHDQAEVTGLVVRSGAVTLPRSMKRWIRGTVHQLNQRSLVEVAQAWSTSTRAVEPQWRTGRGHCWVDAAKFRRRCSAERLAVLMLEHTNPDLRIRRIHPDWLAWKGQKQDGPKVRSRRDARGPLQALLSAIWRGDVTIRQENPTEVVFSHAGSDICAVTSESNLRFLWLPSDEAIPVVNYWLHVHGTLSYLRGCPKGMEFVEIHAMGARLASAFANIRLGGSVSQSVEIQQSADGIVWFREDALRRAVDHAFGRYCEFARAIDCRSTAAWPRLREGFAQRATDERSFFDWLSVVSQLTVRSLPQLPRLPAWHKHFSNTSLFEYLRLREDSALARVHGDYHLINHVEEALGLRDTNVNLGDRCFEAQMRLLDVLAASFADLPHADSGSSATEANPWVTSVGEQLAIAFNRISEVVSDVCSTPTELRLLNRGGAMGLFKGQSILVDQLSSCTNEECWRNLFESAKVLCEATREVVEPSLCSNTLSIKRDGGHPDQQRRNDVWNQLKKLNNKRSSWALQRLPELRNRASHAGTPERRGEWLRLQREIAKQLNRTWESKSGHDHPEFHAPDDLRLKPLEAVCFKLQLMNALSDVLEFARSVEFWRKPKSN